MLKVGGLCSSAAEQLRGAYFGESYLLDTASPFLAIGMQPSTPLVLCTTAFSNKSMSSPNSYDTPKLGARTPQKNTKFGVCAA